MFHNQNQSDERKTLESKQLGFLLEQNHTKLSKLNCPEKKPFFNEVEYSFNITLRFPLKKKI